LWKIEQDGVVDENDLSESQQGGTADFNLSLIAATPA